MICEKCGFDYQGPKCPVCAADEAEKQVVSNQTAAPTKKKANLGLIGMLVSIGSFVVKFIPLPISIPELWVAITGLVLSIIGKTKDPKNGYATAGIIIACAKIVIDIVSTVFWTIVGILFTIIVMTAEAGFSMFFQELFNAMM